MHCISFVLQQCSMHFRCVFTLLQCCVMVGLDWGKPIMYLSLHITCSCIHTFKFLYSCILSCWCFSDYLFLSLSLFLALVCTMAPKRKSTLSQNPLRFGASTSSSNPTPSHVWFRDDKARKDFSENFSRWCIHSEHKFILSDFSDTDLLTVIYSKGWGSLCDILVTCPFVII